MLMFELSIRRLDLNSNSNVLADAEEYTERGYFSDINGKFNCMQYIGSEALPPRVKDPVLVRFVFENSAVESIDSVRH